MQITRQMEAQGNWLFRWRSYLPFLLLPLLVAALREYQHPLQSSSWHLLWSFFGLSISLLGLAVRCVTVGRVPVGTSGRNTRCQVADQLNTLGIYSVVRHPLYLGNFLIGLGIFLSPFHWGLSLIYSLAFWLYYERIMAAEEAFLKKKFPKDFLSWAASTPAFWPELSLWKPALLPFSVRTVLRREYTGLLVVVSFHTGLQLIKNHAYANTLLIETTWTVMFIVTVLTYLTLRAMKKHTQLLLVPGR